MVCLQKEQDDSVIAGWRRVFNPPKELPHNNRDASFHRARTSLQQGAGKIATGIGAQSRSAPFAVDLIPDDEYLLDCEKIKMACKH